MSDKITVLQSFPVPLPTTNPYLIMLADNLRSVPGTHVLNFSWRTALIGSYDVFHVHWPEILVDGHSPLKKLVRQGLTVVLILKLKATKRPIVRTVHNLDIPDGISRRERVLLKWIDRRTTLRIRLNDSTPIAPAQAVETILHGHYRDWFKSHPTAARIPGQFGYTGLIRRYKGVETLISAFTQLSPTAETLSLRIGGKPSTPQLLNTIEAMARSDDRITLELRFLLDQELVEIVTSSELVVLPYRFMHNSGGALAALSLDRPVLVPDNEVNRLLAAEVGPRWIHCYQGDLTAEALFRVLQSVQQQPAVGRPDLSLREWPQIGVDHVRAYHRALQIVRHASQEAIAARKAKELDREVTVAVAILTYRRPEELRRSLPEILLQARELTATFGAKSMVSVLIVDNDPDGSARAVVDEFAADDVRYVVEPTPGISAARNRALTESANFDLLVFIDDDEQPRPNWLNPLIATWRDSGATAVMGRVISEFQTPLTSWVAAGDFFWRPSMATGTEITVAAAGNLLLDLTELKDFGITFSEKFGLVGGEDTLLSRNIIDAGGKIVWCDESAATDFVPAVRTTKRWLLTRSMSHGNSAGLIEVAMASGVGARLRVAMVSALAGSARVVLGFIRFVVGLVLRSERHQARGLRSSYRGLGMIIGGVGIAYQEYGRGRRKFKLFSLIQGQR